MYHQRFCAYDAILMWRLTMIKTESTKKKETTKKSLSARELTLIGNFTALTAVLSQISIPLPFTPIPISCGLVAVYITGILLKPKHAILVQLCYLLLGAVGAPVFSNFRGGIGTLLGPTGGYLFVYPVMAGIVAFAINGSMSLKKGTGGKGILYAKALVSMCLAHVLLYLCGTVWFTIITENTFYEALVLTVLPYIFLDVIKIVFCLFGILPLRSRLTSMNLLLLE